MDVAGASDSVREPFDITAYIAGAGNGGFACICLKSLASMSPEPAIEKLTDSVLPLIFTSPEPFYVNGAYLRFGSAAVNISRTGYVYHENISLYSGKLYIAGSGCGDCDIFLAAFMTPHLKSLLPSCEL